MIPLSYKHDFLGEVRNEKTKVLPCLILLPADTGKSEKKFIPKNNSGFLEIFSKSIANMKKSNNCN